MTQPPTKVTASDFLRDLVRQDIEQGTFGGRVQTRFPPEPNGYLHIGHAKAIVQDFGVAEDFGGTCNLRLDDTNPDTEETEYVASIVDDIEWLGYEPAAVLHASDYFGQLYAWAEHLIGLGLAYVDDSDPETISAQRGGFGSVGVESEFRDRTPAVNLDLFRRMRAGEFPDGSRVLRAKIDMAHENMQLRDPVMYRIRHAHHHRTGDDWCVYPTYDWAHGQSDALEGVTHSLCTLEFDSHRPLYDWYLDHLPLPGDRPRQYEFARLELTHTVTSKRRLATLVRDGLVDGWDDPRMPTLRGLRRRGYPAAAIREFCTSIGTTRTNSRQAVEALESFVRRHLNASALRRMAVLRPLRLVITNWPTDADGAPIVERFDLVNNPEDLISHVCLTRDGRAWSSPRQVYGVNYWLWRVLATPAEGFLCAAYHFPFRAHRSERSVHLLRSPDLLQWHLVGLMHEGDGPGEPVLWQPAPGVLHAVIRREADDRCSWFGCSRAPYTQWQWRDLGVMIHAPVVLQVKGEWLVAGRSRPADLPPGTVPPDSGAHTTLWRLVPDARPEPLLTVPSAGDCSYCGLALAPAGEVLMSYYSQHERLPLDGRQPTPADIFLARIRV